MPFSYNKLSIKKLIIQSRVLNIVSGFASSMIILRYHSVKEDPSQHDSFLSDGIIHSLDSFTKQMKILARDYQPVSMDDVIEILSGKIKLPKKAVIVTFDDGYADNVEIAAPVLDYFGIKGAFYLTVGSIGSGLTPWFVRLRYGLWKAVVTSWTYPGSEKKYLLNSRSDRLNAFIEACRFCATLNYTRQKQFVEESLFSLNVNEIGVYDNLMMNWEQAQQLISGGHIIGSHSMYHPNLAFIDHAEAEYEISESKKIIEQQLGLYVKHFCYPNPALIPNFNKELADTVKTQLYESAVSNISGCVKFGDNNYFLKRLGSPKDLNEFKWSLDATFLGRKI